MMEMNLKLRVLISMINPIYLTILWIMSLIYRKKPSKIPPSNDPLLLLSATTLARKIRQREITCYDAVNSYVERIKQVNRFLNAVVENRFGPAIVEAKIYDEQLAVGVIDLKTLEEKMPLFGVPVTIKECCGVKDLSFTGGCLARKGIKAPADSYVVALLRKAGAIPLCVTNIPEMCASYNTRNLLYGTTVNPYDPRFPAGGSSGGESALLGAGASLIGIGSDLGGSIRIPALYSGVFGHKPTSKLISNKGLYPKYEAEDYQNCLICGPMTRYAEDIQLVMRVLTSTCSQDLRLTVPVDLNQLRVYYLQNVDESYGVLPTTSDIKECVLRAANHFSERGIRTEKIPINWPTTMLEIAIMTLISTNFPSFLVSSDPKIRKSLIMESLKTLFGQPQHVMDAIFCEFMVTTHFLFTTSDMSYYAQQREQLRQNLLDLLGENVVFICPTHRSPANYATFLSYEVTHALYVNMCNIFGFPSLHVPMGLNHEGLPIGVQVIAAPYQDRLCLAVGKELEAAFGGWTLPPFRVDSDQDKYD